MNPKDFIDGLSTIFGLVTSSSSSAFLSVVGLALLLLAGGLAYMAATSKEEFSRSMKSALFLSLIGGMVFCAAGPSMALLNAVSIPKMSTDQAFKNLEENAEIKYVVRLIAYDPVQESGLAIDRLSRLGPSDQLYSFVASYDELVGYKVADALAKVGQSNRSIKRVSAVIFPLRTPLFPANARGLLQVLKEIEERREIQTQLTKKLLDGTNALNAEETKDLAITSIPSFKLASFKSKYPHYCELAREFACNGSAYSAHAYVGSVSHDWHPFGFSQNPRADRCDLPVAKYCELTDWNVARQQYQHSFGARAFLIRNLEINKIEGRVMIDFDRPYDQVIPDIGKN